MTTQKRDYYEVLNVPKSASVEDIKRAFRKLALEFHPDRNKDEGASERFKEINEAYQVLTDSSKREAYDRFGHAGVDGNGANGFDGFDTFGGFGDIFDAFFGGQTTRTRTAARRGADLQYSVTLDFEDAVFGIEKEFEIKRTEVCGVCRGTKSEPGTEPTVCSNCRGTGQIRRSHQSIFGQFTQVSTCDVCRGAGDVVASPCKHCNGRGREARQRKMVVTVPAGVETGTQIRLTGEGEAGSDGGQAGDLYVSIRVKAHGIFERDGNNILLAKKVNFAQAALGATVSVLTLEGETEIEIPQGAQTGDVVRLKSQGVPRLGGGTQRGDEIVHLVVETPRALTEEQRELLQQLSETFADQPAPDDGDKSWFDKVKDTLAGSE